MTVLKVSDLFSKRGKTFDWMARVQEQDILIKRIDAFPVLKPYADELHEFAGEGIASIVFIEYILERLTKACAENNIQMA